MESKTTPSSVRPPEDDEPLLAPGALVTAKYEVVRTLGRGGMGVVYEATNLQTHGRVALKLLLRRARVVPGALARFSREARAAGSLRSPYLARVLDADTTEEHAPFLVMELYEGHDLRAELAARGGRLPSREACSWMVQVCAALADAHAHGFVHRDLKPANVFLSEEAGERRVRVLDFGVSKHIDATDDLTTTLTAVGTPAYMAPEQVRDAKTVDHRVDVWAVGVVLYRCITGTAPFNGSASAVAIAIATEAPEAPRGRVPELPPALERIILRALEKDPDRRFSSVAELARALAPFADPDVARLALSEIERHGGTATGTPAKGVELEPTESAVTSEPPPRRLVGWRRPTIALGVAALLVGGAAFAVRATRAPAPSALVPVERTTAAAGTSSSSSSSSSPPASNPSSATSLSAPAVAVSSAGSSEKRPVKLPVKPKTKPKPKTAPGADPDLLP